MTISLLETDETDFLQEIERGLNAHNKEVTRQDRIPVNFVLKENNETKGGMKAFYVGSHFFVSWLYVDTTIRKQGWGRRLMLAAEKKAKELRCKKVFVDTMSFQAPEFYQSLGFNVCARISNFYEGHDRIFFQKDL